MAVFEAVVEEPLVHDTSLVEGHVLHSSHERRIKASVVRRARGSRMTVAVATSSASVEGRHGRSCSRCLVVRRDILAVRRTSSGGGRLGVSCTGGCVAATVRRTASTSTIGR